MSNYPDLPIITTPDGFEYAEGFNMFMCGSLTSENMAYWYKPAGYSLSLENGYYIVRLASDCDGVGGIAFSRGGYSNKAIVVPGTSYVWSFDCFPDVVCPFNYDRIGHTQCREIGNESNLHVETTRRHTPTTIPANVWTHCEVEFTVSKPSYFLPYLWYLGNISGMKGKAIRFKNFMLQIGTKQHPYRPNPVDLVGGGLPMSIVARGLPLTVRNSIDEAIQNSAAQLEQRLSTSIAQTGESIKNEVSQQYYAKGDTDKLIAEASTILEQKYNSFEMSFNSFKQMVDSNQNLTNAEFATITKFIRFIDGNIFLGEEGNNQMLKIAKDRISFLQGNQEVAYISDSTLYIYDGVFLNSLRIGNFAFVPRANGSLDFKKVR